MKQAWEVGPPKNDENVPERQDADDKNAVGEQEPS